MSKMRSDRRPPLAAARSPMRIRPRRVLRSTTTPTVKTPPGSLMKTQLPNLTESDLRPEINTISHELRALARMVQTEFNDVGSVPVANSSPMFVRGRFYDEYSERRNERLRRKKGLESGELKKPSYDLGVKVESAKRRESKRFEGLRKSVPSTPATAVRSEIPRYNLRSTTRSVMSISSKENKKPPLPVSFDKSVVGSERKVAARRSIRKI